MTVNRAAPSTALRTTATASKATVSAPPAGLRKGEKVFLRLDPDHTLAVQP